MTTASFTAAQLQLIDRFTAACETARRRSHNDFQLAVNVTRLWNWIDADGLPLDLGLTETLWHLLAREFTDFFENPEDTNSLRFTYYSREVVTISKARYACDKFVVRTEGKNGFKSDAHSLIEACGCKWTHRERGYIASKAQVEVITAAQKLGFSAKPNYIFGFGIRPTEVPLFRHEFFFPGMIPRGILTYHQFRRLLAEMRKGLRLSKAAIETLALSKRDR